MKYLSLFSGAMGGDLGMQHLLGWRCLGYVEWEEYCQKLIRQRQEDGLIDQAPIFSDIRTFISEGFASEYKGMVDCITAGFPCQPFSVAGKRAGADDERNMWPATIDCIRRIRPRYAFLENVPGLLTSGYFGTITADLVESGYDIRWRILSAAEVGAPHRRDRLWIVAHNNSEQCTKKQKRVGRVGTRIEKVANTINDGSHREEGNEAKQSSDEQENGILERNGVPDTEKHSSGYGVNGDESLQWYISKERKRGRTIRCISWWHAEPDVGRVANGVASRVDRLKAIGNGQVPLVAATAWRLLTGGLNSD